MRGGRPPRSTRVDRRRERLVKPSTGDARQGEPARISWKKAARPVAARHVLPCIPQTPCAALRILPAFLSRERPAPVAGRRPSEAQGRSSLGPPPYVRWLRIQDGAGAGRRGEPCKMHQGIMHFSRFIAKPGRPRSERASKSRMLSSWHDLCSNCGISAWRYANLAQRIERRRHGDDVTSGPPPGGGAASSLLRRRTASLPGRCPPGLFASSLLAARPQTANHVKEAGRFFRRRGRGQVRRAPGPMREDRRSRRRQGPRDRGQRPGRFITKAGGFGDRRFAA